MKYLLLIAVLAFASCGVGADQATIKTDGNQLVSNENTKGAVGVEAALPKTTIEFEERTLDLGYLKQGEVGKGTFRLTNTGTEPLIISSAKASCGCTVPDWPKEPIAPGESAEIGVEFNSKGQKGMKTKTVTIQGNVDPNPIRLTVKADVEAPTGDETVAK